MREEQEGRAKEPTLTPLRATTRRNGWPVRRRPAWLVVPASHFAAIPPGWGAGDSWCGEVWCAPWAWSRSPRNRSVRRHPARRGRRSPAWCRSHESRESRPEFRARRGRVEPVGVRPDGPVASSPRAVCEAIPAVHARSGSLRISRSTRAWPPPASARKGAHPRTRRSSRWRQSHARRRRSPYPAAAGRAG